MGPQLKLTFICLAVWHFNPSLTEMKTGFHHIFDIGKGNFLYWKTIATKTGGIQTFYLNQYTNGGFNLVTEDFVHYNNQPSQILDVTRYPPNSIFLDDNGRIVYFNAHSDVQISKDDGKTFEYQCKNCTKIISDNEEFFDSPYTAVRSSKLNLWIAAYNKGDYIRIVASKDVKNWKVGNKLGFKLDINIHGFFEMAETENPKIPRTFFTFFNKVNDERRIYGAEFDVSLRDNDVPVADALLNKKYILDHGYDFEYYYPADEGVELKTAKKFYPILYNRYVYFGTNGINWSYLLGTPRSVTYKKTDNKLVFYQMPLTDFTNKKYWDQFSITNFKFDGDKDPFSCQTSISFSISAEIDTKSVEGFSFRVRGNKKFTEFTDVGFNMQDGCYIDRKSSGISPSINISDVWIKGYQSKYSTMKPEDPKELDFVGVCDTFSVEIYCFKGALVVSAVIFPDINNNRIKLVGKNGDVIKNVKLRTLKEM